MEASSTQQQKEKEPRVHRPCAFDKMEGLVREMQDPEKGVPVRSQKQFLTSIPSAFMGCDLIKWLMQRLSIEESVEAVHIANQLCQYGYFFPVNDSKTLTVKDDSSLYRFQTPCYWPWQHKIPDRVQYAIYLCKRNLRNKQRHALEEYEIEALNSLHRNLQNRWDIIQRQAEEQVRLSKEREKEDKIVSDSQERAFWRVYRPPPGCPSSLDVAPVPSHFRLGLPRAPSRKRTPTDLQREVALLRNSLTRTRIKVSAAIENLKSYFETYVEYDPMFVQPQPSNPWISDDQMFWKLNKPVVKDPTEKRVKRWKLSMEELMSDPTGLQEFTSYLEKEHSHENIRFWLAVQDLRHSFQAQIPEKVNQIFKEFLEPKAPCEINIDGKTMEKVQQEMKNPSRFTFDAAAEHVYTLLLKKDCYPRFIRSDQYQNLLTAGAQPLQKKRLFNFVGQAKKKVSSTSTSTPSTLQQQQQHAIGSSGSAGRRRGSDRSLSGSAHELAICGVRDVSSTPRVPHSHSQSNLTDIPYRDAGGSEGTARPMDDVCPWDVAPGPSTDHGTDSTPGTVCSGTTSSAEASHHQAVETGAAVPGHSIELARASRKNSTQLDSCSSSSDVSLAVAEVSERLRKSCSLQHSGSTGGVAVIERSGPAPPITRNYSIGSTTSRVKLADMSRPSLSSCNYLSSQQSFEYSYAIGERLEGPTIARIVPEEPETVHEPLKTKSTSVDRETCVRGTAKAPLISISAIVGDLPSDTTCQEPEDRASEACATRLDEEREETEGKHEPERTERPEAEETLARADTETEEPPEEAQVVPVWEPDTRQDDQTAPVTQAAPQERRDNNVNEVCPWEDEENCRVDAPYVKTYATLGYL